MPLRDILPDSRDIPYTGKLITMHGLSLEDITALLKPHKDAINMIFSGKIDFATLISQFPEATAAIITAASWEKDEDGTTSQIETIVRHLPANVQLACVEAVWDLTTAGDGEEFVKRIRGLAMGLGIVAGQLGVQMEGLTSPGSPATSPRSNS